MSEPLAYMQEPWFTALKAALQARTGQAVAAELGVSGGLISQVVNGTGRYGSGKVSTARFAARVIDRLSVEAWQCPHLTEYNFRKPVVITLEQCRKYAHRPFRVGSYEENLHWVACQRCPNKARSAPPAPPPPEPKQRRSPAAAPSRSTHPAKEPQS